MDYMFSNCKSLRTLGLFNLNLEKTSNVSRMFYGCDSLSTIYFQSNGKSETIDYTFMFGNCFSLTNVELSVIINDKFGINMDYMFNNCTNLTKIHFNIVYSGYNYSCIRSMKFMFNNCSSLDDSGNIRMEIVAQTDISYMFNNCTSLSYFDLTSKLKFSPEINSHFINYEYMFNNCTSLESIDLSSLNIENKLSLRGFLNNCISLINVELKKLKISNVIDLSYMFENCKKLSYLDLSDLDNLAQINTLEGMFYNCVSLSSLNLSQFDTSRTTNMKLMFYNCYNLISLNLLDFDTSLVTDMNSIFSNCKSLEDLNLSSFETSKVTDMSSMFKNCESIKILNLNNFETSSVKRMDNMFKNCYNLFSLYITNFKTKAVESMASMFENCRDIEFLNVSSFDTSSVTDMSSMFNGCIFLDYINMSNFTENNLVNYNNIFNNTRMNLVYCINSKENSNSILMNIIKNNDCSVNECGKNWKEKQRIMNREGNKCVESCIVDEKDKYEFKSECYEECPNNTYLSNEELYKCDFFCEEKSPFYNYFQSICIDNCSPYNFFKQECSINNQLLSIQEKMTSQTDNSFLHDIQFKNLILEQVYNNNENLIMQTNENIYQISSFKNGIEFKTNTKINFTDIQDEFSKIFILNSDSRLVIFSTEIHIKGIYIPIVQYSIYDLETGTKLDLNKASNIEIIIKVPAKINTTQDYKHNPFHKYYYDPCIREESDDGFDLTIDTRIDEYAKNNYSLCEVNCEFISLDTESKIVTCKCKIKSEFKSLTEIISEKNLLNTYVKRKKRITNFFVLSCIKLLFEKNDIWKNYGNYMIMGLFVLFIIDIAVFIIYGYDNLKDEINRIVVSKAYLIDYEEKREKILITENL